MTDATAQGSTGATFPMRVAAIDAGSNAIRFVAAEFVDPTHWVALEVQRVPVRLGHNAFLTGQLDPEAMAGAVACMSAFRRSLDNLGISQYRAVATSAVRDSKNGAELVNRIRRESGIRLETITGTEEARLVWTALRSRVDLGDDRWLSVDLGGGSLEVSLISSEGIHWTESHTMGTVRLLEDLGQENPTPREFRRLLSEYTGTLRFPGRVELDSVAGLLATGGNMESLADLMEAPTDDRGTSRVSVKGLRRMAMRLARMTVEERMERYGLGQDRADVIVPAALIYLQVARLAGVEEIIVPRIGVKEGVLLDVVEDLTGPAVHASRMEQQAFAGALALGRRFQFDELHARHVARLSLSLFDQLGELHELGEADRRVLLVAAVLHDVGQFISYRRHHKHSLYLVYHSEVPGVSRQERILAALVARYHRRAEPKPAHFLWDELSHPDRERVRRLASLLRVADAMDREHMQRITRVTARVEGDRLALDMEGRGDLLLEYWALRKKGRMFTSVFGLEVAPVHAAPDHAQGLI
jgi:exopolyphosphatase/guanosine-5'-triphosphate,3'-diphosphate pyrophosphatase